MSLEYRSEKSLELFAFPALRPTCSTLLSQHPHLPSAIDWQDAVHTRQERAIQLQSVSNTSSSSFAIGSHKGHKGKTHVKVKKSRVQKSQNGRAASGALNVHSSFSVEAEVLLSFCLAARSSSFGL